MPTDDTSTSPRSNTRVVAKNFLFSGLEVFISIIATLLTTVAVARVMGPQKLGYFNFIYWLTSTSAALGSLGIPMMTLKYMGEYLGRGDQSLAKTIFVRCLWIQTGISFALAVLGEVVVFSIGDPQYRWMSFFLVLSILPVMVSYIPSQANTAAEDFPANTKGTMVGVTVNVVAFGATLIFGWGLLGLAVSVLLFRTAELAAKLLPLLRWSSDIPSTELPPDLRRRMFAFSGRSTGLMMLQLLVWDRSDIIFLKILQADIRQIAFFSVSFSLAERLLLLPQALANSLGATQMAEYGRDRERLYRLTGIAATYMMMTSLPILLGAACLSQAIVRIVYGQQYLPAIPVFAIVAVFAVSKGLLGPAQTLLYSTEDLGFLLKWGIACGIVNVILDVTLIPGHGAIGAAIANGLAQTTAAAGVWARAVRRFPLQLKTGVLVKLLMTSLCMVAAVLVVTHYRLPLPAEAALGVATGVLVFFVTLRLVAVLQQEDRQRLLLLGRAVPGRLRPWFGRVIDFLAPAAAQADAAASEWPTI